MNIAPQLRTVNVTRYVTPLREGGSLPAIAATDDGFLYVLKFRGAGQGVKVLIAELIGGEIARTLGLKVPEIVFARLDEAFGRTEPDEEIQDLLKASVGLIVPRVEREEFLNIGVILYCAKQKFLRAKYLLDETRLHTFAPDLDIAELKEHICSMERICLGNKDAGPIGKLDIASRFRWLTATRSTIVQTSKVHPGFCDEASETLRTLFEQLVG